MILEANRLFIAKIFPSACKFLDPTFKLGNPSVENPMALMIHKVTKALLNKRILKTAMKAKETIFFCHFVVIFWPLPLGNYCCFPFTVPRGLMIPSKASALLRRHRRRRRRRRSFRLEETTGIKLKALHGKKAHKLCIRTFLSEITF